MSELDRTRLFRANVAVCLWLPPEPHTELLAAYRDRLPRLREYVKSGGASSSTIPKREPRSSTSAKELFTPLGLLGDLGRSLWPSAPRNDHNGRPRWKLLSWRTNSAMKYRRFVVPCLLAALFAAASWTAALSKDGKKAVDLKVGDQAPSFIAHDDEGNIFNSADHIGKKNIVLFFYPAAMTGG